MTFPCAMYSPTHGGLVFLAIGLVQRVIRHALLLQNFCHSRDKLGRPHFFARETPMNSDILKFSPRADCRAHRSRKMPCDTNQLRGLRNLPSSARDLRRRSPQIWPHLPALLGVAIGGLRNLNGPSRRCHVLFGLESPPEEQRNTMHKSFLVVALLSLSVSSGAMAQQQQHGGTPEEQKACAHDVQKYCRSVMDQGDLTVLACLQQNRPKLTKACDQVLVSHGQ
jgi:hypothetical protein